MNIDFFVEFCKLGRLLWSQQGLLEEWTSVVELLFQLKYVKKFEENCIFCGNTKNLSEYKGKLLCDKCAEQIAKNSSNFENKEAE